MQKSSIQDRRKMEFPKYIVRNLKSVYDEHMGVQGILVKQINVQSQFQLG